MLGALLLVILFFILRSRYRTHWKPWIGIGWIISFDENTGEVTIPTFLIKSPAARAGVKRGSVILERDGIKLPELKTKQDFLDWKKSWKKPVKGKSITYLLKEPLSKGEWSEREVTITYGRIYGDIPHYPRRFFTSEERQQHWRDGLARFRNYYPTYRCRRTGVIYETRRIVPID
jgi:hypothetical protein